MDPKGFFGLEDRQTEILATKVSMQKWQKICESEN